MNNPMEQSSDMHLPPPVTDNGMPAQSAQPIAQPAVAGTAAHAQGAQSSTSTVAQDRDIIEPEWVHAVEQTMRQYIEDPRKLADELNGLKAQYIQKRYGKEIKKPPSKQGQ